jgi:cardiolipin synthase A/B
MNWEMYNKWEWGLIIFGALSLLYAIVSLFTFWGDNTPPAHTKRKLSLDDERAFMQTLAATVHSDVLQGSEITILEDGEEFIPDLLDEIRNAEKRIHMTNYIWDKGEFGDMLWRELIKKAEEGVEVRVLLDGLGGHKATNDLIKELEEAGGHVAYFRKMGIWNATRLNMRTHIRDITIDGRIAYIGGIAFADEWLGTEEPSKSWHDYMYKFSDGMAVKMEYVFANFWSQTTGEIIAMPAEVDKTGAKATSYVSLFSIPSPDLFSNMEHFLWLSMNAASTSIHIENPYILLSDPLLELIKEKAESGVEVVIISAAGNTDAKHVRWASQYYYKDLLDAGAKIYEYQSSRIHAKNMIVDGKWSVIGSANLDNRSSRLNLELILGTNDRDFAARLEEKFVRDLENSKQITKEEWKNKFYVYPLGFISRFLVKQY